MKKRRAHKLQPERSSFMREYFNAHYEDPAYLIINRSKKIKELLQDRFALEEGFAVALKNVNPDLYDRFDEIIGMYLSVEVSMLEEAYILGVQDRDRALKLQR